MKALTLHQPWASLIAVGAKTIETRSWSTRHRGRVVIHAGKRLYTAADKHHDRALWDRTYDALDGLERNNGVYDLPYGAIVASATLADCVPIIQDGWPANEPWRPALVIDDISLDLYRTDDPDDSSLADEQLPFGDFSAGRWAWLLEDIAPTIERCPWCWGAGRIAHHVPGVPDEVCQASTPCSVCWPRKANGEREFWNDGRAGRCEPIPARGRQGLWTWQP